MRRRLLRIGCSVAVIGALSCAWGPTARATVAGDDLSAPSPAPLSSSAAHAPERARAQALLEQGNELFRAGDAGAALETYRRAYDAFASAKLFFNIGRCEEALSQPAPALRDLSRFLREATDADPAVRAEAEARVAALAATLVAVELTGARARAEVAVDGVLAGVAPLPGPLWIPPGRHRLSVGVPGRAPWVTSVDGKAGQRLPIAVPPEPPPIVTRPLPPPPLGPTPVAPDSGPRRTRWPIWAALGAVLLAGAAVTFVLLRDDCPATECR